MKKAQDRLDVLKRIEELEKQGVFDVDVENDPPTIPLLPNKIDYLRKKPINKLKAYFTNKFAKKFINNLIKNKQLIIKKINGLENMSNLTTGAILTCNHFNAFDNFAIQKAFEFSGQEKKRNLFKVIREGNYTSFKGVYAKFFKNCNTLPISSVTATMKKFLSAVNTILKKGDFILIYPEQAMWWNYKKPRPFKNGAFRFAVESNVPVLPIFITMEDSQIIGQDGFNVQEYTINILPAIYPQHNLSLKENINYLRDTNFQMVNEVYSKFYN